MGMLTRPPEGDFSRPPLSEPVIGARCFADASEGCCVGRVWSHRAAAEGQVELGSRSCFLGMYVTTKIFSQIHLDITTSTTTTTTEQQYVCNKDNGNDVQMRQGRENEATEAVFFL